MTKQDVFNNIESQFSTKNCFSDNKSLVINGDSIDILKEIPTHSISLILTDPPYHSTKKNNIINDKSFGTDNEFVNWIEEFAKEWKRILKPSGSIFMFCSSCMEAKLEIMLSKYFNVLSHIVWTKPNEPGFDGWKGKMRKESLRQWYPHSERIIFMESRAECPDYKTPFSKFLKEARVACKLSGHQLTEEIGAYGSVNHGGAVSNWESGRNIPSANQYERIVEVLKIHQFKGYIPRFEDIIRPFEVNARVEFTDIWTFPSVRPYKGKHPAEKPINMLEHCILSSTFEGDIVLDCFAGSGSTLIAAIKNQRRCIGIEIDKNWYESIVRKLETFNFNDKLEYNSNIMMKSLSKKELTGSLFPELG